MLPLLEAVHPRTTPRLLTAARLRVIRPLLEAARPRPTLPPRGAARPQPTQPLREAAHLRYPLPLLEAALPQATPQLLEAARLRPTLPLLQAARPGDTQPPLEAAHLRATQPLLVRARPRGLDHLSQGAQPLVLQPRPPRSHRACPQRSRRATVRQAPPSLLWPSPLVRLQRALGRPRPQARGRPLRSRTPHPPLCLKQRASMPLLGQEVAALWPAATPPSAQSPSSSPRQRLAHKQHQPCCPAQPHAQVIHRVSRQPRHPRWPVPLVDQLVQGELPAAP